VKLTQADVDRLAAPRWRWATRNTRGNQARVLWTAKPECRYVPTGYARPLPLYWCNWGYAMPRQWGARFRVVTRAYCMRRFGRDLPPGKIRRLP